MTDLENSELEINNVLSVNREFKDKIFGFIFGHEKNKVHTLSLFNAVSGRNYKNPDDIEITTIEDFLYLTVRNDLSFIIDDIMNIYEHQSTYNPNIPVRMFLYAAGVYQKYIKKYIDKRIYTSTQQHLPIPKLICFYNGVKEKEDRIILNLRDAFNCDNESEPDIDVRVTMLNINYGHNKELMEACKPLNEYSWFMDRIRTYTEEYRKTMKSGFAEKAAEKAIDEMPSDWILKRFLNEHRAEVGIMWQTELNEQELWDGIRAAFKEEADREVEQRVAEEVEKRVAEQVEKQVAEQVEKQVAEKVSDEKKRADEAETRAYSEKNRADSAEAELARYKAKFGTLD